MNIMYADRQFLLVPFLPETDLIDRIILGNQERKNPFDLTSLIDQRTLDKHASNLRGTVAPADSQHAWAFYLPTPDCPLTYRELSLWFMLWSIQPRHKRLYFQQSFSGLETLLGIGKDQPTELAARLQEHDLINVKRTEGWAWWFLKPFEPYAHWFKPLQGSEVPAEFLAMAEQYAPKPPVAKVPVYEPLLTLRQDAVTPERKAAEYQQSLIRSIERSKPADIAAHLERMKKDNETDLERQVRLDLANNHANIANLNEPPKQ